MNGFRRWLKKWNWFVIAVWAFAFALGGLFWYLVLRLLGIL
jgi:hypothetical protein